MSRSRVVTARLIISPGAAPVSKDEEKAIERAVRAVYGEHAVLLIIHEKSERVEHLSERG